jgi:dolichyl-diphosphooligosaccharide--protein glycosyltransferase
LRGYDSRLCIGTGESTFNCVKAGGKGLRVNIQNGTIQGKPLLKRCVMIREGVVQREIEYPNPGGRVLQLVERDGGNNRMGHFLPEVVYRSNFNQMFMLGRYDPTHFEEIYDDFPETRTFRLKPKPTL